MNITRILYRLLNLPNEWRDKLYCRNLHSLCCDDGATFAPETKIHNSGPPTAITIGSNSLIMGELLTEYPTSQIAVGEWCYIGPGSRLWSMDRINIGNRVFISQDVSIFDNNSHSLSATERHFRFREKMQYGKHLVRETVKHDPVIIENDVWIGFNAAILKGVIIGKGAIVGAHSVVAHDVAPYTIMAGNPARKIGECPDTTIIWVDREPLYSYAV